MPERLQHKLLWGSDIAPLEFQTPGQLLLYVGLADSKSLDSILYQMAPALQGHVLAFDIRRESDHDILQGPLYDQLCTHAWRGDLQGAGGGPNCRTWSILRTTKPGAPVPVPGRPEPECWSLSTLQPQEQMDTDNDSLLLLRLMVLAHVIHLRFKGKGLPWCFLEHPEDPKLCSKSPNASRCSTIWQTHAVRQWCRTLGLATIHFDQCELGQCVAKSTVLATDLPLRHWTGMTCTHGSHQKPSGVTSSDLSRYPPMMMRGLAQSIVTHTSSQFGPPPIEDSAHSLQSSGVGTPEEPMGGLTTTTTPRLQALPVPPPTEDSAHSLQSSGVVTPVEVKDRPTSTPTSRIQALLDPTVLVRLGFKVRPLRDGGGKPSPGRQPPPLRKPPPVLVELGKKILALASPWSTKVFDSIHKQEKVHPFPEDLLTNVRALICPASDSSCSPGQPFYLEHIQFLAQLAGDPDADYSTTLKQGVPLGVDTPVLRSPDIWPTKEELKGEISPDPALEAPTGRENYSSAETHAADIRATFVEEMAMDMVLGPFTASEAASHCNCLVSELCPGPMAAIDEGDKIRTIYDGSWGRANAHIQAHCAERTTAPTVMDCMHGIHWLQATQTESSRGKLPYAHWEWPSKQEEWMLLKADVTKAHRRIKILPAEWKYQVARLGDEWWINKVGTYGMASAQIYWGRMAALLLRLVYHTFPLADWGFVFVDDFCWLLRKTLAEPLTTAILLLLVAVGCPLSWKKTAIGSSNTWLGFLVTPSQQLVWMAPTKHDLVMSVLSRMANEEFTRPELDSALGRLQWATTCCPLTKPFLQAFWQWRMAVKSSGRPSKLLRGFAKLLYNLFDKDFRHQSSFAPQSSWWGASDASASDDGSAFVGGWLSDLPTPSKHQVSWFHYKVEEHLHPWAFKDKKPKRRIAALEMFGTLLLTMFLCRRSSTSNGYVQLPLASDNQGNVYGLLGEYTKKMPTAGLLMEVMFQLTANTSWT